MGLAGNGFSRERSVSGLSPLAIARGPGRNCGEQLDEPSSGKIRGIHGGLILFAGYITNLTTGNFHSKLRQAMKEAGVVGKPQVQFFSKMEDLSVG